MTEAGVRGSGRGGRAVLVLCFIGAMSACASESSSGNDTGAGQDPDTARAAPGAVSAGGDGQTRDCDVPRPAVIDGSGVGYLTVGKSVNQLRERCTVLADTVVPGPEGQPERRITVVAGAEPASATIVDDRVWRIEFTTPRFRTRDDLGVGSTLSQLRSGPLTLAVGEGRAFVLRADHCGLSFRLARGNGVPTRLEHVADSTRVDLVFAIGCEKEGATAPQR